MPTTSVRKIAINAALQLPFTLLFVVLLLYYVPSTHGLVRGVQRKLQVNTPPAVGA